MTETTGSAAGQPATRATSPAGGTGPAAWTATGVPASLRHHPSR